MRRRLDAAFVGKLAQHALELDAAVVLQVEGARDLAGADLAGVLADEGEDFFLAGEGDCFGRCLANELPDRAMPGASKRARRCVEI